MTANKDCQQILRELKEPFESHEIEWRAQRTVKTRNGWKAIVMPYVTNRAIQNRLDKVFGLFWSNEYFDWGNNGVKCVIKAKIEDEWVSKEDGAENTDVESIKGGFSSAMKRAAVQWGIGRYLYELDSQWVPLKEKGENYAKIKDGNNNKVLYWDCPNLSNNIVPNQQQQSGNQNNPQSDSQQQSNKASNSTNSNNQPTSNNDKQQDVNQQEALKHVEKLEKAVHLDKTLRFSLFKKANKGVVSSKTVEEGSLEELRNYYDVLLPVSFIVQTADTHNIDKKLLLAVCQNEFDFQVESINNLFLKATKDIAKKIVNNLKQYNTEQATGA